MGNYHMCDTQLILSGTKLFEMNGLIELSSLPLSEFSLEESLTKNRLIPLKFLSLLKWQ